MPAREIKVFAIKLHVLGLIVTSLFSGCVTLNDITRPNLDTQKQICADIAFVTINKRHLHDGIQEKDLDSLSREKILQVLATFNINTKCDTERMKLQVKIHRKMSPYYEAFLGGWSVVTVLSAGIIPSYSSFETDISVIEASGQSAQSTFKFRAAVWTPFVFKQVRDDSYAFDNYKIDSRSAVIGIEIAKLIRTLNSTIK